MIYDVAIIGMGFAGLSAVQAAVKRGLSCVVIAPDAGASLHFSGAFDIVDPFFFDKKYSFNEQISITDLIAKLMRFDPGHAYNRVHEHDAGVLPNIIAKAKDFFDFYNIPVSGGDQGIIVFGSSGRPKLSAFSLTSQGLDFGWRRDRAVVIHVPGLSDYPAALIEKNLQCHFNTVRVATCMPEKINPTAALASLLQLSDNRAWRTQFKDFLRKNVSAGEVVFMPPLLGLGDFDGTHHEFESDLKIKIIELLSVLPSVAGARLQVRANGALHDKAVSLIKGRVTGFVSNQDQITAVTVKKNDGSEEEVFAKEYVLATGKFLGGGIAKQDGWRETVFGLDLFTRQGPLSPERAVVDLISDQALEKQSVFSTGVLVDAKFTVVGHTGERRYRNVKACGHVLTGFDFSHERCGFGISLATGLSAF